MFYGHAEQMCLHWGDAESCAFEHFSEMPSGPLALDVSEDIIISCTSSSLHNRSSMDSIQVWMVQGSSMHMDPRYLLTVVDELCRSILRIRH